MVNTSCCIKGFLNRPHHLHFFQFCHIHFLYISWMQSPWMSINWLNPHLPTSNHNQQLWDLDIFMIFLPSHEPRKAPLWVYSLDRRCTEVPGAQVATWNPSPRSRQPHPPRTKLTKRHGKVMEISRYFDGKCMDFDWCNDLTLIHEDDMKPQNFCSMKSFSWERISWHLPFASSNSSHISPVPPGTPWTTGLSSTK